MLKFYRNICSYLILISLLSSSCFANADYTIDEVKAITNDLGVFTITIHNHKSTPAIVSTRIKVLNLPNMAPEVLDTLSFKVIQPHTSIILFMQKPYLSTDDMNTFKTARKPLLNEDTAIKIILSLDGKEKVIRIPAVYENNTPFLSISNIELTLD